MREQRDYNNTVRPGAQLYDFGLTSQSSVSVIASCADKRVFQTLVLCLSLIKELQQLPGLLAGTRAISFDVPLSSFRTVHKLVGSTRSASAIDER